MYGRGGGETLLRAATNDLLGLQAMLGTVWGSDVALHAEQIPFHQGPGSGRGIYCGVPIACAWLSGPD